MTPSADHSPEVPPENEARFRWQTLFQKSSEPLFLLNRRRRLLYVNPSWEKLTGLSASEVKGQSCRRRPRGIVAEHIELILAALAPPPEVLKGQPGQARRRIAGAVQAGWWHIAFFPIAGGGEILGILGKITVLSKPEAGGRFPLSEKLLALRQRHVQNYRLDHLIGDDPAILRLGEQIRLAAPSTLPVLLVGAAGTGKHWAARAIHELSARREQAFLRLDCSRLPAEVLADLLFSSASASHGAIYLQNAAQLPRDLQQRLLERLDAEEGPRFFAALELDPLALVQSGQLLHDLYCRLSALVVPLPALTERMADFAGWVEQFLARASQAAESTVRSLHPEALRLLRVHSWPGNLQELYTVILEACFRAKGEVIEPGDLPFHLRQLPAPAVKTLSLDAILEQVERRLIVQALQLAKNNKSKAAELLSIWRPRLLRRLEALGIQEGQVDSTE
jgi:transcriptional regulator with PAS, ATPase and Fis domain